jgi:hypothetical protein
MLIYVEHVLGCIADERKSQLIALLDSIIASRFLLDPAAFFSFPDSSLTKQHLSWEFK